MNSHFSTDYDVLELENIKENPFCNHGYLLNIFLLKILSKSIFIFLKGPTILFTNGKNEFYGCSACRDHKLCNFYYLKESNKTIPTEKLGKWHEIYQLGQESYTKSRQM